MCVRVQEALDMLVALKGPWHEETLGPRSKLAEALGTAGSMDAAVALANDVVRNCRETHGWRSRKAVAAAMGRVGVRAAQCVRGPSRPRASPPPCVCVYVCVCLRPRAGFCL